MLKLKKDMLIFILLLVTGLSGMLLTFFTSSYRLSMNAIVPIPKVFVDDHYLYEKKVNIYSSESEFRSYDLQSEAGWPFKNGLLIEFYSLLNSLDRPHLVSRKFWKDIVDHYFCQKHPVLKEEITSLNVYKVEVLIRHKNGQWRKVKEHQCSH